MIIKKLNLVDFYGSIKLDEEAINVIKRVELTEEDYHYWKVLFYCCTQDFYREVKSHTSYRKLFLYLYVRFACDLYEDYKNQNISDDIYYDTFRDISIWCHNCYKDYGEYGIEEYDWIRNHLKMDLFRIGRLQYEKILLWKDIKVKGKLIPKGTKVLNMHIPQGEPLDEERCKESLLRAREFFPDYEVIVCHTWLLYSSLEKILPSTSNILKFQKLFHIYEIDLNLRQGEERIFGKRLTNPLDYPENTSLQRMVKQYLVEGNILGAGYGAILL